MPASPGRDDGNGGPFQSAATLAGAPLNVKRTRPVWDMIATGGPVGDSERRGGEPAAPTGADRGSGEPRGRRPESGRVQAHRGPGGGRGRPPPGGGGTRRHHRRRA